MRSFLGVYALYKNQGFFTAYWSLLRLLILPLVKIDKQIPKEGKIVEIGCGNGLLSNYLSLRSKKRSILGVDLSKKRINQAVKSIGKRKNIKFINTDATSFNIPKADCYLFCDVFHHIPYNKQVKLLKLIVKKMSKNSRIVIKDVDPSNKLPFLFGHIIEKILYPNEKITTRTKSQWEKLFYSLGLKFSVTSGIFYFPDSTLIYTLTK